MRALTTTPRCHEINKLVPSADEAIADMQPHSTLYVHVEGSTSLCLPSSTSNTLYSSTKEKPGGRVPTLQAFSTKVTLTRVSSLAGGFGLCGVPDTLITSVLAHPHIHSLTAVSNNAGTADSGLGLLLASKQIKKMIASYLGSNKVFEQMYITGQLEVELTPQGTLAERCRAGGAGIPAFYTPAGGGTIVQTGELILRHNPDGSVKEYSKPKDMRVFNGKSYLLEEAIYGDYAFVKAWRADRLGNCQFRYSAQNFNGVMGRNARTTIVEAEEIVEVGGIEPGHVGLPGIYVTRVVQSNAEKKIEKLTMTEDDGGKDVSDTLGKGETANKRERIVRRAAKEFKNGMYANLGIGMPMLAPSFLDPGVSVQLQSEVRLLSRNVHSPILLSIHTVGDI